MNPPVVICLLTRNRTECAIRSIDSICHRLRYDGSLLWYIADDGSTDEHHNAVHEYLAGLDQVIVGQHHKRMFPGPSWNLALSRSLQLADFIFWLEDDWTVSSPSLDITPYINLLQEHSEYGMVRLGLMPTGLEMYSVGIDGRIYMRISKSQQYCYSGNPSIRHRRHFEAYGGYSTDERSAGDNELFHDALVRSAAGPDVLWPLEAGTWGFFGHIGKDKA